MLLSSFMAYRSLVEVLAGFKHRPRYAALLTASSPNFRYSSDSLPFRPRFFSSRETSLTPSTSSGGIPVVFRKTWLSPEDFMVLVALSFGINTSSSVENRCIPKLP
jgi:hypothetical protein